MRKFLASFMLIILLLSCSCSPKTRGTNKGDSQDSRNPVILTKADGADQPESKPRVAYKKVFNETVAESEYVKADLVSVESTYDSSKEQELIFITFNVTSKTGRFNFFPESISINGEELPSNFYFCESGTEVEPESTREIKVRISDYKKRELPALTGKLELHITISNPNQAFGPEDFNASVSLD